MNGFRTSALAIAIVLALNSFVSLASAQCNAGRQIDTTNLNLGLQAQAAPVVVQGGGCANGQCGASAAVSTQAFAPAVVPQSFVAVNTPRVAVNVGVARAYQPLYVVTSPTAIVAQAAPMPQYAFVSALQAPASASASASAGAAASAATSVDVSGAQVLAFDPSVGVNVANVCAGGNCGGRTRILGRFLRPRRNVSVARSRSVTFN